MKLLRYNEDVANLAFLLNRENPNCGILVVGQPKSGKSTLLTRLAAADLTVIDGDYFGHPQGTPQKWAPIDVIPSHQDHGVKAVCCPIDEDWISNMLRVLHYRDPIFVIVLAYDNRDVETVLSIMKREQVTVVKDVYYTYVQYETSDRIVQISAPLSKAGFRTFRHIMANAVMSEKFHDKSPQNMWKQCKS